MHVTPWVWVITLAVALGFLVVDVFVVGRRPHEPTWSDGQSHLLFFVCRGAAVLPPAIFVVSGADYGAQFLGGWLTEYSLSVDNLFVFLIIIASCKCHASCSNRRYSSGS